MEMTFYHQQLLKIKKELYPPDVLTQQIVNAKIFMDTNFSDNINVSDIAGEAFYSKFHFIRLFKNLYGRTPHQYLKEIRIQKAKKLIREGTPVRDTCFLVGFNSVSSFSGLFKKITGTSPSFIAPLQGTK